MPRLKVSGQPGQKITLRFAERLNPVECVPDEYGAVAEIRCEYQELADGKWKSSGEFVTLPARAVMIAAGTWIRAAR